MGRQRAWEWRGAGAREATLLGDTLWGPGPGSVVGREGLLMGGRGHSHLTRVNTLQGTVLKEMVVGRRAQVGGGR